MCCENNKRSWIACSEEYIAIDHRVWSRNFDSMLAGKFLLAFVKFAKIYPIKHLHNYSDNFHAVFNALAPIL